MHNIRPDLTALLRNHGETELLVVELEPDIFTERGERRSQFCQRCVSTSVETSMLAQVRVNLLIFRIDALKRMSNCSF